MFRAAIEPPAARGQWVMPAVVIAAMIAGVGLLSPDALVLVCRHGTTAIAIFGSALGWGLVLVRLLWPARLSRWDRVILAGGLGLGLTSIAMLALGSIGVMHRWFWIGFVAIGMALNVREALALRDDPPDETHSRMRWLWLMFLPFAVLAIVAAALPPGVLWPAEANGYDVLEYHLGAPREYFEAGRIGYLPHNIYSNFPFNVEMVYLLAMVVHGDAIAGGTTAQLVNVLFAVLMVGAVWWAARPFGRNAGVAAAVLAASCPFVVYLCGVAYVECGMLMYAALALGAVLRGGRAEEPHAARWLLLGGFFAGLACGCKYTGVPAVAVPLALAVVWMSKGRRPGLVRSGLVFVAGAIATFSPWMIKNVVVTGNPVFPLAQSVMPMRDGVWDSDGAARWQEGHLPDPAERGPGARLKKLWLEVIGNPMFGWVVPIGVLGGIGMGRRRGGARDGCDISLAACWLMLGIGAVVWVGFTHLVGRFAVVLIIPASVLIGAAVERWRLRAPVMVALLIGLAGWNLRTTAGFFTDAHVWELRGVNAGWFSRGEWPGQAHVPRLNELARGGSKCLMVGDARGYYLDPEVDYCVVFNRNPLAEAANDGATAALQWLRDQKYEYLYVDWGEMRRLRRSRYGFWKSIDEALIAQLKAQGLTLVEDFTIDLGSGPRVYSSLFRVPAVATQQ